MKKKLFFTAIAAILLTGCAKEDMNASRMQNEKNLITFDSPVTGKNVNTKAVVHGEIGTYTYTGSSATYTYPKNEKFIIFAVKHTGNLTSWGNATPCEFNGDDLQYDQNVDSWAPKQTDGKYFYWPDNTKMSFAAVSPANLEEINNNVTPEYSSTGLTIEGFTIPATPDKHFDLMFSKRAANKTAANMNHTADAYSGIPLEFQHALSSIHFSLKKDNTVTEEIKLTKIVLKNAKNKGTFKENITEGSDASAYEVGSNGNVSPEWTVDNTSTQNEYVAFTGEVLFPIEAQYVSALAAADGTDDGDTSNALLLIPQELADNVTIDIEYYIDNQKKTKTVKLNTYPSGNPLTEWVMGYRYTYRLYYSKDSEKQDIISFGPTTTDWIDGGRIEIRL